MKAIIRLIQLLFATTFVVSGFAKCIDPAGTAIKLSEYLQYFGLGVFVELSMAMSWVLCIIEFLSGYMLLMGHNRKLSLVLSTVMMAVFTPLTLWLALTNAIEDCGCFGDLVHLSNTATLVKNIVLDVMLVLLWVFRRHLYSIYGRKLFIIFKNVSLAGIIVLCWFGTWREPVVDFRPFLPGLDLRSEVLGKGSVGAGESDYLCVYEREGVRQKFDIYHLPDEDDGWTFVETIERPSTKSTVDFFVKDLKGEVKTDELLSAEGYSFLLLSASLDLASQHDIDRIEQLCEYSSDCGYPFYCVTSREMEQYRQWCYNTGAEYPFLFTDKTIVETICRSNPCVMLLKDGVICWKQPLGSLDTELLTSGKLDEQSSGEIVENDPFHRFLILLILLFSPYLLYLLVKTPRLAYKLSTKKDSKDA